MDAIAHVVRVFDDKDITHVHNRVDPSDDIEIIKTELELADLESKQKREGKNKDKDLPPLSLLSDKKVIYVFNVSEKQLKEGWHPPVDGIVLCSTFELLLSESTPEEQNVPRRSGIKAIGS